MMSFLIMYPQAAFALAVILLLVIWVCLMHPRPFIIAAIFVVTIPVLPIIIVRCLAVWTVDLCDWLTVGRTWTIPTSAAVRWLGQKL